MVSGNRINSFVFNDTTTTFKQLFHVVNVVFIEIRFFELIRDDKRRVFIPLFHRQSKLRCGAPILKSLKNLFEGTNELAFTAVWSTVTKDCPAFTIVAFQQKKISKFFKYLPVWIILFPLTARLFHFSFFDKFQFIEQSLRIVFVLDALFRDELVEKIKHFLRRLP